MKTVTENSSCLRNLLIQPSVRRPRKKLSDFVLCVFGVEENVFCSSSSPTVEEFLKTLFADNTHTKGHKTDCREIMRVFRCFNVFTVVVEVSCYFWAT